MPALNCSTVHNVSLIAFQLHYFSETPELATLCLSAYAVIFVLGVSGNRRPVILSVRRPHMKTVTNVFITNLAVADCLVYLVNGPMVTTLGNWGIGQSVKFICKLLSSFGRMCRCLRVSNRLSYTGGPTPNFITCICMLH